VLEELLHFSQVELLWQGLLAVQQEVAQSAEQGQTLYWAKEPVPDQVQEVASQAQVQVVLKT
jgi:hypothetical protein